MPYDMYLTEDRDLEIDATGDIRIEVERDNIRQQHANAAFRASQSFEGRLVGPDAAEDLRIALRRELRRLRYVEEIVTLNVDARPPNTLTATVETNAVDAPVVAEMEVA